MQLSCESEESWLFVGSGEGVTDDRPDCPRLELRDTCGAGADFSALHDETLNKDVQVVAALVRCMVQREGRMDD